MSVAAAERLLLVGTQVLLVCARETGPAAGAYTAAPLRQWPQGGPEPRLEARQAFACTLRRCTDGWHLPAARQSARALETAAGTGTACGGLALMKHLLRADFVLYCTHFVRRKAHRALWRQINVFARCTLTRKPRQQQAGECEHVPAG